MVLGKTDFDRLLYPLSACNKIWNVKHESSSNA